MTTNLCLVSKPTLRWEGNAGLTGASSKGGRRAESPPTFIRGTRQKNRNMWSTNFKCERFGSCFYARGKYWHPTRPSQGTVTFNQMCNIMSSIFLFFLFYVFVVFYGAFCIFLSFCGPFCILYLFVVDKGVSLAPTYPKLRWGNQTYVVLSELNIG